MTTITLEIPKTYQEYLKGKQAQQAKEYVLESFFDYVENKQDEETIKELAHSKKFQDLNTKLEKKL